MVARETIQLDSPGEGHMTDITGAVAGAVRKSGMKNGIATVFVPGATGSVTTIEYEDGLERDFAELMEEIIPKAKAGDYHHNKRWGDGNGHSHVRASLLGPSLTVPVSDGQLTLGTWQQIVFLNFDNKSRTRSVIIQMVGE
ncbi:secondary thiamine-phosphate synthase enzyme YjbQ [bacterium]